MSTGQSHCCFCKNLASAGIDAPWDTVLHDSGNFVVVPTKGALVPGWLLVVAKQHIICSGALEPSELDELADCLATARNLVQESFGPPTVFEHGPSQPGTTVGCGVDHVHVHVAPLNFSLQTAVSDRFPELEWKSLPHISATRSLFNSGKAYSLVEEPREHAMYWCEPPVGVRQLFRRVIAAEVGIPDEFDYITHPQALNVLRTLAALPQCSR